MDSITHIHGLTVYVKEGLPFARDLSLENSADSYFCFRLALRHSLSYLFFLYRSPSLCTVFDSISSKIDEVHSIKPSANVFVLGLTYSGRTARPGELYYNFSILNDLTQMVNFPVVMVIFYGDSGSPALLDLFISSVPVFFPKRFSLHWEILIMLLFQFPLILQHSKRDALFHRIAYDYSCADWDGLHDYLRDVP